MICVSVCGFMCAPRVRFESEDRFCSKEWKQAILKKEQSRKCIQTQAFAEADDSIGLMGERYCLATAGEAHLKAKSEIFHKASRGSCKSVCCACPSAGF